MKAILSGKTYDTATATLIAMRHRRASGEREHETHENLYKTKGGAFFVVNIEEIPPGDPDEWMEICSNQQAHDFVYDSSDEVVLLSTEDFPWPEEATA